MSSTQAPRHSERPARKARAWSIPGKVFVLGEYAVLAGMPAVIATVGPRFSARLSLDAHRVYEPAPESPASLLLARLNVEPGAPDKLPGIRFEDPSEGSGGFGASTAQFALFYAALCAHQGEKNPRDAFESWKLYRELTASEPTPPSGADLAAQLRGGVVVFDPSLYRSGSSAGLESLNPAIALGQARLLIFSASAQSGRKVRTHEHLRGLGPSPTALTSRFKTLREPLEKGIRALESSDPALLGSALSAYGERLRALDLELPATTEDRQAFAAIPQVLGVKGCGALQADAICVLCGDEARSPVLELAERRGLKLVSAEPGLEDGLREEPE